MERIIIEYHSRNGRQVSKLLMAAVIGVLEKNSVKNVCITQEEQQSGSRNRFSYAGFGGVSNGL